MLNSVTKFHKVVINFTGFIDRTPSKMMNFNEQRAITPESMVQYGPLLNEEDIMVLNDVTKFHKILIKTIRLRDRTSFKTVNFHKQRAITPDSMVRYGPLSKEECIMVLNDVTKFHKILIITIRLRERTSFKRLIFTNKEP